jgi:hypothetical protein
MGCSLWLPKSLDGRTVWDYYGIWHTFNKARVLVWQRWGKN